MEHKHMAEELVFPVFEFWLSYIFMIFRILFFLHVLFISQT